MCEQLGLDKNLAFIYHHSHVPKTMVIAVTGYAFEENIENGGHGIKIMMHRGQGSRIAKKQVKESQMMDADNGNMMAPSFARKVISTWLIAM